MQAVIDYTLHLADSALILAQRNGDWCGHGPVLEQDIAITNITLDLIGQSRSLYQYAATLLGGDATEDTLAYLRNERDFKNCLLTEQPNGDWGQTVLRQYFFSCYQRELYTALATHPHGTLAAIAEKSLKEVNYHCRWSGEWVIRLGDGTAESQQRMHAAIDQLWPYTGELFMAAPYEKELGIDPANFKASWLQQIHTTLTEATLSVPDPTTVFMHRGGKEGIHTEQLGYLLATLQHLQRAYPNSNW
jgi:ring-1,2-phenylacetyl-CoA epoxidase subunit PaaC